MPRSPAGHSRRTVGSSANSVAGRRGTERSGWFPSVVVRSPVTDRRHSSGTRNPSPIGPATPSAAAGSGEAVMYSSGVHGDAVGGGTWWSKDRFFWIRMTTCSIDRAHSREVARRPPQRPPGLRLSPRRVRHPRQPRSRATVGASAAEKSLSFSPARLPPVGAPASGQPLQHRSAERVLSGCNLR